MKKSFKAFLHCKHAFNSGDRLFPPLLSSTAQHTSTTMLDTKAYTSFEFEKTLLFF